MRNYVVHDKETNTQEFTMRPECARIVRDYILSLVQSLRSARRHAVRCAIIFFRVFSSEIEHLSQVQCAVNCTKPVKATSPSTIPFQQKIEQEVNSSLVHYTYRSPNRVHDVEIASDVVDRDRKIDSFSQGV